ncbi:unnamed protein product [Chrysoparadoxa australica]
MPLKGAFSFTLDRKEGTEKRYKKLGGRNVLFGLTIVQQSARCTSACGTTAPRPICAYCSQVRLLLLELPPLEWVVNHSTVVVEPPWLLLKDPNELGEFGTYVEASRVRLDGQAQGGPHGNVGGIEVSCWLTGSYGTLSRPLLPGATTQSKPVTASALSLSQVRQVEHVIKTVRCEDHSQSQKLEIAQVYGKAVNVVGKVVAVSPVMVLKSVDAAAAKPFFMMELEGMAVEDPVGDDEQSIVKANVVVMEPTALLWRIWVQPGRSYYFPGLIASKLEDRWVFAASSATNVCQLKEVEPGQEPAEKARELSMRATLADVPSCHTAKPDSVDYEGEVTAYKSIRGLLTLDGREHLKLFMQLYPCHQLGAGLRMGAKVRLRNVHPVYLWGQLEGFGCCCRSSYHVIAFPAKSRRPVHFRGFKRGRSTSFEELAWEHRFRIVMKSNLFLNMESIAGNEKVRWLQQVVRDASRIPKDGGSSSQRGVYRDFLDHHSGGCRWLRGAGEDQQAGERWAMRWPGRRAALLGLPKSPTVRELQQLAELRLRGSPLGPEGVYQGSSVHFARTPLTELTEGWPATLVVYLAHTSSQLWVWDRSGWMPLVLLSASGQGDQGDDAGDESSSSVASWVRLGSPKGLPAVSCLALSSAVEPDRRGLFAVNVTAAAAAADAKAGGLHDCCLCLLHDFDVVTEAVSANKQANGGSSWYPREGAVSAAGALKLRHYLVASLQGLKGLERCKLPDNFDNIAGADMPSAARSPPLSVFNSLVAKRLKSVRGTWEVPDDPLLGVAVRGQLKRVQYTQRNSNSASASGARKSVPSAERGPETWSDALLNMRLCLELEDEHTLDTLKAYTDIMPATWPLGLMPGALVEVRGVKRKLSSSERSLYLDDSDCSGTTVQIVALACPSSAASGYAAVPARRNGLEVKLLTHPAGNGQYTKPVLAEALHSLYADLTRSQGCRRTLGKACVTVARVDLVRVYKRGGSQAVAWEGKALVSDGTAQAILMVDGMCAVKLVGLTAVEQEMVEAEALSVREGKVQYQLWQGANQGMSEASRLLAQAVSQRSLRSVQLSFQLIPKRQEGVPIEERSVRMGIGHHDLTTVALTDLQLKAVALNELDKAAEAWSLIKELQGTPS